MSVDKTSSLMVHLISLRFQLIVSECMRVCVCVLHYLMEFLKWSSAGFFTVQLLSNHRSASIGSSGKRSDDFVAAHCKPRKIKTDIPAIT